MFKHNTYDDQPEVPTACPILPTLVPTATEATTTKVDQSEAAGRAEEPKRSAPVEDFDGTS